MRARPATTPPVLPGHSRGNSSVETGVQLPWTDAGERSRGDLSTVQMEGIGATAAPRGLGRRDPVAGPRPRLPDQARRLLLLQYQSYPTEFMGCMIGAVRGDAVIVQRIAPADVNPGESTPTSVVPRQTCEDAGWANTVGMVHSQQWYLLQLRVLGAWW